MAAGRNSIGYERDSAFLDHFGGRIETVSDISRSVAAERLSDHLEFVAERSESGTQPDYESEYYGFPVMTSQEETLRLYVVDEITIQSEESPAEYRLSHRPADRTPVVDEFSSD